LAAATFVRWQAGGPRGTILEFQQAAERVS